MFINNAVSSIFWKYNIWVKTFGHIHLSLYLAINLLCLFHHVYMKKSRHIQMHMWKIFSNIFKLIHTLKYFIDPVFHIILLLLISSLYSKNDMIFEYSRKVCQPICRARQGSNGFRLKSLLCGGFGLTFGREQNQTEHNANHLSFP